MFLVTFTINDELFEKFNVSRFLYPRLKKLRILYDAKGKNLGKLNEEKVIPMIYVILQRQPNLACVWIDKNREWLKNAAFPVVLCL